MGKEMRETASLQVQDLKTIEHILRDILQEIKDLNGLIRKTHHKELMEFYLNQKYFIPQEENED